MGLDVGQEDATPTVMGLGEGQDATPTVMGLDVGQEDATPTVMGLGEGQDATPTVECIIR
jgi:hypothetical protein